MRLVDPATLSPADLVIAQLAETDPHHELIVAVRLALEIADARRACAPARPDRTREVAA